MPNNQREITTTQSWPSETFKNDIKQTVIRKFITSAIYVEKPIMPPLRKTSPISTTNSSNGEYTSRTIQTDRSVKRCTCVTSPKSCPCHFLEEKPVTSISCESSSSSSDVGSQITVKSKKWQHDGEIKLSLSCLHTDRTERNIDTNRTERNIDIDPKEKEEIIKNWLKKKDIEKKKKELEEARLKQAKEREKEQMLEKEKGNFNKWLARKKLEEERIQREKERKEEEKRKKEAEIEKKKTVNETSYQAWVRKKKRAELEKKIKGKLALLQVYEEKQKRMEENEKAFEDWLEHSKNRPKPVPLNQGMKSLCSSLSITYINPVPWVPNLEESHKPASQ